MRLYDSLVAGGMVAGQARAVAEAVGETVDAAVGRAVSASEEKSEGRFVDKDKLLELATRADVANLDANLGGRIDKLDAKVDNHFRIMIGLYVFQTGVLLGVLVPILLHISVKL